MDNKSLFKKYYTRMTIDGLVKAFLLGVITGLSLAFIIALISYLVGFDGLWYALSVGIIGTIGATLILFYTKFRPSAKKAAQYIDRLGLEERLITMMELEKDESYIAMRQREDAREELSKIKRNSIKISVSSTAIALIAVLAVFATSMTLVSTLSARGDISYMPGLPGYDANGANQEFVITYEAIGVKADGSTVEGVGSIEGDEVQIIRRDQDGITVVAVAKEGWVFALWNEDELPFAERTERRVQGNATYTAIFLEMGDGEGEGEPKPGDGEGEGEPGPPDDGQGEEDGPPADGAGGQYDPINQVIDNDTYYRDVIDSYVEDMRAFIAAGGVVDPAIIEMIETYYGIII